jgi:hypothetical protein
VRRAASALGVFTLRDIAYQRKDATSGIAGALERACEAGRLQPCSVRKGAEVMVRQWIGCPCVGPRVGSRGIRSHWLRLPGFDDGRRVRILSPFDNLVINRKRASRIFGLEYTLECYVPAAKRKFGYFALPVFHQGQPVGLLDCKADRKNKCLMVNRAEFDWGADPAGGPYGFSEAFAAELTAFACLQWLHPGSNETGLFQISCYRLKYLYGSAGKLMKVPIRNSSLRIAGIYAVASSLWIVLSDRVLYFLAGDYSHLATFQTFKGIFFVAATSVLLFFFSRSQLSKVVALQSKQRQDAIDALREKEVLLREVHHRVKNNMQVIVSLLSLKDDAIACAEGVRDKVRSMALVHELLYASPDLSTIDAAAFTAGLAELMRASAAGGGVEITQ